MWLFREDVLTVTQMETEDEASRRESLSQEEAVIGNVTCVYTLFIIDSANKVMWLLGLFVCL